jgi:hypothetical protein
MSALDRKGRCAFLTFPESLATRILASDIHTVDLQANPKLLSPAAPFSEDYKHLSKEILGHVQALSEGALKDVFRPKPDVLATYLCDY